MVSNKTDKHPKQFVSFHDLRELGFDIFVKCFEKNLAGGRKRESVKVLKVTKKNSSGEEKTIDLKSIKKLLWVLGIDTTDKFWVEPKKYHRTLKDGKKVVDYRYCGYERIDRPWLLSGMASEEAIALTSSMEDMNEVLDQMKNGGDREPKK